MSPANDPDPSAVQTSVNAYWNWRGPTYDSQPGHGDRLRTAEHEAWVEAMRSLLPPAPAEVLDVGAGTGFLSFVAHELGHRVTGIDLAEGMLAVAREHTPGGTDIRFDIGDAVVPDFPDASFDAVISRHVIWTLRDPQAAFQNWRRVLRPGGRFVAIDAFWFGEERANEPAEDDEWRDPWLRYYSDDTRTGLPAMHLTDHRPLVAMAEAAGFVDIRLDHLTAVSEAEETPISSEPRYALTGFRPTD